MLVPISIPSRAWRRRALIGRETNRHLTAVDRVVFRKGRTAPGISSQDRAIAANARSKRCGYLLRNSRPEPQQFLEVDDRLASASNFCARFFVACIGRAWLA